MTIMCRCLTRTLLFVTQLCLATGLSLAPRGGMPEQFAATSGRSVMETWFSRAADRRIRALNRGRLASWQEALSEDPSLFDGCKDVFLDVGSNRGTHVRKLFEPTKYPTAKYLEVFDDAFGDARSRPFSETGLCAFGFEANPRWVPRLLAIEKAYTANDWRVLFFAPNIVSNETGETTFWTNDDNGEDSDWGASEFKNDKSVSKELVVAKLDMPHFMKNLAQQTAPGVKLMKMDIEGGEYTVLPPLLEEGLLCAGTLNTLTIEWHRQPGVATLGSLANVWQFEKNVTDRDRCLPQASTEVLSFDDESFRDDGVPIPGFTDDTDANPEGKEWRHKGSGAGMHAGAGTNCRGAECPEVKGPRNELKVLPQSGAYHAGSARASLLLLVLLYHCFR